MARRGGFLTGLIGLVGLLVLALWVFRDRIPGMAQPRPPVEGIGPAAAEAAQAKLRRLVQSGDTVHLTEAEFTSLIRYHLPGLAGPLLEPSVDFVDNTFFLNGRMAVDQLPDDPQLENVRRVLPDTADVVMQGELRTLVPGKVALRVSSASFARIPLNEAFVRMALRRFGKRDEPGLREDEYLFTLPAGVQTARVEAGELVLGARAE
jgi:hypothetical protein